MQPGFFDADNRLAQLSKLGDPLEVLACTIPWDEFAALLRDVHEKERKSNAGRKPFDALLMFKVLVLQTYYNLSDDQVEYQIRDRLSFMRFLGLQIEDRVPDAKTVWLFRERLAELGLTERLFDRFADVLEAHGYQARKGQIIDASIVKAPVQRNRREDNEKIKRGEVPEGWSKNKRRQKDSDARWTKKHGKSYYGYKNHISVDAEHKLIRKYVATPANVHDSQAFDEVIDVENADPQLWADCAYRSEETEQALEAAGYESHIHEKGQSNAALTPEQQERNRERSRIRVRVEHVFGSQENEQGGKFLRTIGLARAKVKIGLMNLLYNFRRFVYLEDRKGSAAAVSYTHLTLPTTPY